MHAAPALAALALASAAVGQTPAVVALLPDTQYYSETAGWTRHFNAQTSWLVAHRDQFNVRFVSHLGDIVDNGASRPVEWDRARAALGMLQGVIPFSVCLGNHDYQVVSDKTSGRDAYLAAFGPEFHAGQPGYVGSDATGGSHAMIVNLGDGASILDLAFQWRPEPAEYAWARAVLAAHPGVPVMISTHEALRDPDSNGLGAGRSPAGEDLWANFVRGEPRVFLVVNGHFHSGQPGYAGEHHQVALNAQVLPVYEFLSDYQGWPEGGTGYLRLVTLDPRNSLLSVRSFSPSLGRYVPDHNSDMRFMVDFPRRFGLLAAESFTEHRFRQGLGGYTGCLDAELRSDQPDTPLASRTSLDLVGPGASTSQALLRFDGLFDPAAIPADRGVLLAKLRFTVSEAGSGFTIHRLRRPFSAASTWNTEQAGIAADGAEALAVPDAIVGGPSIYGVAAAGVMEVDVTRSLRAWQAGEPNHGWALLPHAGGSNPMSFFSADYALLGKPELLVWTTTTDARTLTFRQGEAGYASSQDVELRQADQGALIPDLPAIAIDADQPAGSGLRTAGLLRFDNLFGEAALPPGAWISSATLTLTVTEAGGGLTLHRLNQPWTERDGWSRFGADLDADDSEAMRYPDDAAGRDGPAASVPTGALRLDVTESLRAWQAGAPNEGWLLAPRPGASDALRIATGEAPAVASRPLLSVKYTLPCPADFTGDGFLDFFDYDEYVACFESGACPPGRTADFNGDSFADFFDYDDFVAAFEAGC